MIKLLSIVYLAMSVVTFCVYAVDKWKAKRGRRRIPENTLHELEFLCGWPGALLAQKIIRHKSVKTSFRTIFWIMVAANAAIVIAVLKMWVL